MSTLCHNGKRCYSTVVGVNARCNIHFLQVTMTLSGNLLAASLIKLTFRPSPFVDSNREIIVPKIRTMVNRFITLSHDTSNLHRNAEQHSEKG